MQRKKIQDGGETSRVIALGGIVPNAWNKRGDEGIPELAASIAARGQLEEIVVRPVGSKYEIVAGERRWRALRHNQATEVRCHVMEIDEATARAITFIENAERKRLTPFEEAEEIAGMAEAGAAAEEIAAQIGRPAAFVRRRLALRVLDLKAVEKTAEQGGMSAEQIPLLALELLAAGPEIKRADLPPWALESVANMRRWLLADRLAIKKAPWHNKDRFGGLPRCAECPSRTRSAGSLFPELENGVEDLCLVESCWAEKMQATVRALAAAKIANGQEVLLIGDDFDADSAQEAGVRRRSDYAPAKKGEKGAVQALAWDGPDAGKSVWVLPPKETKSAAKAAEPPPDRKKWAWIAKEASRRVDERLEHGPTSASDGIDWEAAVEDLLRYGVESRGLDFNLPANAGGAQAEIEIAIGPGLSARIRQIGRPEGTDAKDRADLKKLLSALFGRAARELVEELERLWDQFAEKASGGSKSRKKRG